MAVAEGRELARVDRTELARADAAGVDQRQAKDLHLRDVPLNVAQRQQHEHAAQDVDGHHHPEHQARIALLELAWAETGIGRAADEGRDVLDLLAQAVVLRLEDLDVALPLEIMWKRRTSANTWVCGVAVAEDLRPEWQAFLNTLLKPAAV